MAILKDLIVHGPSHFIGKVFINDSHIAKINESDVPENPKFTDTVSSMSTTGTGNAITSVSVNNGSFTFTKGSTFLTSQNTAALFAGTSAATTNTSAANTNAHLILKDGSTYNRIKIQGTAGIEVTADSNGVLSVGVPAKSSSLFYAGPASGANAVPNFRNIGLTDLPVVSAITSAEINATSQKIATVSAISEYVEQTSIEYITGSNVATSSSAAWVGNSKEKGPLRVGKTIAYKLSHNPTGNATLQLSFSDGTASSAYPVYSMTTRVTTHYPKNSVIFMSFDGSYWRTAGWYNTNDTAQTVRLSQACAISKNAAQRYVIFFTNQQGELIPSYTGAYTTATTKNLNTGEYFDPFAPIYYCNSTATLAAGGTLASNVGLVRGAVSLAYGFNSSGLLTAKEPVYVRCIPSPEGTMVKLDGNNCIVQTLPTEEDGFVYILLGYAYSTSAISLIENHPVYTFKSGAIRNYQKDAQYDLGYVTPQMFGARGDGNQDHDDTIPIQKALNSSLEVFFPAGTYFISAPLIVRSNSHIWGTPGNATVIKAASNFRNENFSQAFSGAALADIKEFLNEPNVGTYMMMVIESTRSSMANNGSNTSYGKSRAAITTKDRSNFIIEKLYFNCNNVDNVGGLHLFRPYNQCAIRDIYVGNCSYRGIEVGDTYPYTYAQSNYNSSYSNSNTWNRATRAQTLVIDNCFFYGTTAGTNFPIPFTVPDPDNPSSTLSRSEAYQFKSNTYTSITSKIQTATSNNDNNNKLISKQSSALGYFYNCFELNLKDSKFLFSSVSFKIHPCIILDFCTDVYVRGCSFAHTLGEGVRITGRTRYYRLISNTYENLGVTTNTNGPTGNGFVTGGGATIGSLHNIYFLKGSTYYPYFTQRPYVINIVGQDSSHKAEGGIILETTYNNTPNDVRFVDTNDTLLAGSFKKEINSTRNTGTVLLNTLEGTFEADNFNSREMGKKYTISTETNANVSPWGAMSYINISSDITNYGTPIGAIVQSNSSTNPAVAYLSGTNLVVCSKTAVSNINVRVVFNKTIMS